MAGSGGSKKSSIPERFQLEQNQRALDAIQAYRPEYSQGRQNVLAQILSMSGGLNNALGQMYGPGAMFDSGQATMNPLSPRGQDIGAPVTADPAWSRSQLGEGGDWGGFRDQYMGRGLRQYIPGKGR